MKVEKVSYYKDDVILPTRADKGSAGYDFYLCEDVVLNPNQTVLVPTNIKAQIDEDKVLLLYIRSSIGIKKKIILSNNTGVIDSTYYNNENNEGNICCALYNYGTGVQVLRKGDRIMQGVIVQYHTIEDDHPLNNKRIGGIGSSGN